MKKPMTLAEQVKDAQKTVSGWSTQRKDSVRIEGTVIHVNRGKDGKSYTEALPQQKKR
ncbi:MAG: hypothetical protein HS106_06035 [Ideonella sp.]|nr:hypothetical protein [Ideonella sp.]